MASSITIFTKIGHHTYNLIRIYSDLLETLSPFYLRGMVLYIWWIIVAMNKTIMYNHYTIQFILQLLKWLKVALYFTKIDLHGTYNISELDTKLKFNVDNILRPIVKQKVLMTCYKKWRENMYLPIKQTGKAIFHSLSLCII